MASITFKKKRDGQQVIYVTYRYKGNDGKTHQPWVRCASFEEAQRMLPYVQKAEDEGREFLKVSFTYGAQTQMTSAKTISEMVEEYFRIKQSSWQPSTWKGHESLYLNYIKPIIGPQPIVDITAGYMENYYADLLTHDAVPRAGQTKSPGKISERTVYEINKILRPAFNRMVRDRIIPANPCAFLSVKDPGSALRTQWSADEVINALNAARDDLMSTFISTVVNITARTGEGCALTWDQVHISDEDIATNRARISINKTLTRVYRNYMDESRPDILFVFPSHCDNAKSVLVLKSLKTKASYRDVYISPSMVTLLKEHQAAQEKEKAAMGSDYHDYNLVFAQPNGDPWEVKNLEKKFKRFCEKNNLRKVDLYTLRHSGATIKMIATKDIKAIQADMGHATAEMTTKVYIAVVDEERRKNAEGIQEAIFDKVSK